MTYDQDHFEPDLYNKHQVNWKNGRLARVFLLKAEEVDEDSNTVSMNFANTTTARTTKTKNVVINSNQILLDLIKEGTEVDSETILCTFSDDINGSSEQLSAEAAATLAALSQYTPRAGVHGVLDRVEVIYNGEIEDMSPSLAALIRKHDTERRRLARLLNDKNAPKDGRVEDDYRVDGIPLGHNQVLVRFYLTYEHTLGPSDKLVIANQLKTTIQESMVGINRTEDGRDGEICFGRESVDARIVGSVSIIGSSTECSLQGGVIVEAICEGDETEFEEQIKRIMDPKSFPTVLD